MSLEFNRRSFLKYSAAAAVAVAGSSLLTGCGEDEYQKTGKIGSTLKLMGTFKMYDNSDPVTAPSATNASGSDYGSFVCHINIKCTTKKVPLCVNKGCFELTTKVGTANEADFADQYITVNPTKYDLTEGNDKDFTVTVIGSADNKISFVDGDKVEFKYWPRIQASSGNSGYTRAFCTWKMTARVDSTTGTVTFE